MSSAVATGQGVTGAASGSPDPVVIVPVWQAVEALDACLTSLARTLPPGTPVLIADDASPDPAVAACIRRHTEAAGPSWQAVRREENLGFVGNVNLALAQAAPADVILLNADTRTTAGWFEAILACAGSDPRIATITPWSNNAEICSLPDLCRAAPMPDPGAAERIAAAVRKAGAPQYPELPTGVGFCMYIRRAAIDRLGDLDAATFGRGYGEENDFCRRAAGHGWRNVLCDDAYVAHQGGASFGPAGLQPGGENLARLNARYPHYNDLVARFIREDPLAPLRARIAAALQELGKLDGAA